MSHVMRWILTMVSIAVMYHATVAQTLDLSRKKLVWVSHLNQTAGKEDQDMTPHRITIDLENKFMSIANESSGDVIYDLAYSSVYSGQSKSVVLQDGESMFMVRDDEVNLVTFDEKTQTLSVILLDNTIRLFGRLQVLEGGKE